ncbi:unnamed protein product [Malus baccata var. baccata]
MRSQAIDTASSSGVYTSACEETQSGGGCTLSRVFPKNFKTAYIVDDDIGWSFYNDFPTGVSETEYTTRFEMNNFDSTRFTDTTSFYSANSSNFGDDDTGCFSSSVAVEPSHASLGKRRRDSTASKEGKSKATPHATIEEVDNEKDEEEEGNDISQVRKRPKVTCGQKVDSTTQIQSWLEFQETLNSFLVEGDDLFLDSTASEEGKSKATPHATTEEVDNEKDEEEEGNDISQVRKRPKVTCGQKSNSVAPSSDDEEATPVQQGLIDPLAVRTAPPQVQEFNSAIQQGEVIAGNNPAASDVAMTIDTAITDGATNDATALSQNATQIPSLTTVIVSNRGLNNQQADQSQPSVPQPTATVGSAISATTNMTAAPESSNPALVQSRPTSDTNQDFVQDVDSQEKETEPTSFVPENGKGKIVVQRDVGTEKAQDLQPPVLQPTATTGVVISATTNAIAASKSSNPALVQLEPTSIANEDFAQDVAESQEKETEPTSVEPENGKSKAVVQNDFGTGKSHKFSEVVVMSSHKKLHELLDRASAPNTLASSCSSTPTIDSQAIATTRATLEMDFITMAGEVQRTHMISCIQSLVDSNCFPTGTRPMILAMLKQLEQFLAYSEAYSVYDIGKNLTDQVEATKQLLQPKVQFCDSKEREFLELEEKKMKIEARQAAILAEIHGAVKETEPIQAHLEKLLLQQDQFKENESNFKNILDIGDGLWTTLKSIIHRHLPT